MRSSVFLLAAMALPAVAATYSGPRPPRPDVPYLMHADHLIETETGQASEENRKNETSYSIPGAASPAKTPLAEPIFLVDARSMSPERLELYRLEVRNGHREVVMSRKRRGDTGPLRMTVTRVAEHLYKIEVDQPLDNGEYSLSPSDSNQVFCFEVY